MTTVFAASLRSRIACQSSLQPPSRQICKPAAMTKVNRGKAKPRSMKVMAMAEILVNSTVMTTLYRVSRRRFQVWEYSSKNQKNTSTQRLM